ncbi:MAG: hypothetical protein L3J39_01390 [Verrucomicrobiales bacterium]|nr:hypothetical protein [Verrucomicrobiales bacterium]
MNLPTTHPFDYLLLMSRLEKRYNSPRNKIQQLVRSGEIIRIKKGLYVTKSPHGENAAIDPFVLSGLIYGPSYVSLETALAYHQLIPERVDEITCITSKRKKRFHTPLGRFTYAPINEASFPIGIKIESGRGGSWYLAEPEKALCDRIAQVKHLHALRDVPPLLRDNLRIAPERLEQLRLPLIIEIASHYRQKNVSTFANWFAKHHS